MGEGSSEVGPIYRSVESGLWRVDIPTLDAMGLDRFFVCNVGQADKGERLGLAMDARTAAEIDIFVFPELDKSSGNVSTKRGIADEMRETYHLNKPYGGDGLPTIQQPCLGV